MGIMSDIDIMRQEGAREPEDFMAWDYNLEDSEAMAEIVQRAETSSREARLERAVRLNPGRVTLTRESSFVPRPASNSRRH